MRSNADMRAVQGQCARRGGASARGGSCCGVAGAHRSKVRLWAHARRGRRETLDVPALKKGAIGLGCRTVYPSFEAPWMGTSKYASYRIFVLKLETYTFTVTPI